MAKWVFTILVLCSALCVTVQGIERNDTLKVKSLLEQSMAMQRVNADSCLIYASQALQISEKLRYQTGIRGACIRIGSALMTKGLNDSALFYIKRAADISKDQNDWQKASGAYILLSYVYQAMGMQDSAFSAVYQALNYSKLSSDPYVINQTYMAMGELYYDYGDLNKALEFFQKALSSSIEANDEITQTAALQCIGNVQYRLGNIEIALKNYLMVDSLLELEGDKIGIAQNLSNIGLCYGDLKYYNKAFAHYQRALGFYKTAGMRMEEANLYYNISALYLQINEYDQAIGFLERSIEISREINNAKLIKDNLKLTAEAYAGKGNYYQAYNLHLKYSSLSDSLLNSEKVSRISEMQTRYETELKEQQIILLSEKSRNRTHQRNAFVAGTAIMLGFLVVVIRQRNKVKKEQLRSEALLLNILPQEIAKELKEKGRAEARHYENVSILFTDFKSFTELSEKLSAADLVTEINDCFAAFDHIIEKYSLEKIKTIGDAYMAVGGLPIPSDKAVKNTVLAALEMQAFIGQRYVEKEIIGQPTFEMRAGIHTGPVVAGIVGVKKFQYDIWGDAVNTASRTETGGEVNKVNISKSTYDLLKDDLDFVFEPRGQIEAKGKGSMEMYFVALKQ